jgi:hypothetical protein
VINRIETRGNVGVDHMTVTVGNPLPNRRNRLATTTPRPKPVRPFAKVRFKNRFEYQTDRTLNDSVLNHRNAQRTKTASSLRYEHAAHRLRPVLLGQQLRLDLLDERDLALRLDGFDSPAIDSRRTAITAYPIPGLP